MSRARAEGIPTVVPAGGGLLKGLPQDSPLAWVAEISGVRSSENLLDSADSGKVYLRAMVSIPQRVVSIPQG